MFLRRRLAVDVDYPTLHQCVVSQTHWVPSRTRSHCHHCAKSFSLFRLKHHCRLCGEVVCIACRRVVLLRSPDLHERFAKLCVPCVMAHQPAIGYRDMHRFRLARRGSCIVPADNEGHDVVPQNLLTPTKVHSLTVEHRFSMLSGSPRLTQRTDDSADDMDDLRVSTHAIALVTWNERDRAAAVAALPLPDAHMLLTHMAGLLADTFHCSMAFVSFVGDTCEWFAATEGLDAHAAARVLPRHATSVGATLVATRCPRIVLDATADRLLQRHVWVTEDGIKIGFFAAAPIFNNAGYVLGTVGVIDGRARADATGISSQLRLMAKCVAIVLEPSEKSARRTSTAHRAQVETTLRALLARSFASTAPSSPDSRH
ncbi:Aste57867_15349 [Aphanomyces stellatus]|uniref:Aste57867_15349 protein n=1 Tax=Aphanomyces stellatus TaxID=120398 RepID=A0A485L2X9_9STRA|nr:hypothetical protein As57867_015293 [Aphanomyces stellatus]VFT92157.1 Aste57867_15349 [Aphanomyces stellatus]